jgi:hypothetical protein
LSQCRAAGGHFVGYEKLFVNHLNSIRRQSWSGGVEKKNAMKNRRAMRNKSKRNMLFWRENCFESGMGIYVVKGFRIERFKEIRMRIFIWVL